MHPLQEKHYQTLYSSNIYTYFYSTYVYENLKILLYTQVCPALGISQVGPNTSNLHDQKFLKLSKNMNRHYSVPL